MKMARKRHTSLLPAAFIMMMLFILMTGCAPAPEGAELLVRPVMPRGTEWDTMSVRCVRGETVHSRLLENGDSACFLLPYGRWNVYCDAYLKGELRASGRGLADFREPGDFTVALKAVSFATPPRYEYSFKAFMEDLDAVKGDWQKLPKTKKWTEITDKELDLFNDEAEEADEDCIASNEYGMFFLYMEGIMIVQNGFDGEWSLYNPDPDPKELTFENFLLAVNLPDPEAMPKAPNFTLMDDFQYFSFNADARMNGYSMIKAERDPDGSCRITLGEGVDLVQEKSGKWRYEEVPYKSFDTFWKDWILYGGDLDLMPHEPNYSDFTDSEYAAFNEAGSGYGVSAKKGEDGKITRFIVTVKGRTVVQELDGSWHEL